MQDNGRPRNPPTHGDTSAAEQYGREEHYVLPSMAQQVESSSSSSSPSGGLACAIAALAERQQMSGESSTNNYNALNMLPGSSRFSNRVEQYPENYPPVEVTKDDGEWGVDHVSEVAEAGTSYASSDATDETVGGAPHIVPESFEEQMMLAMAVSLAEARARTSAQGVSWQKSSYQ